MKSDDARMQIAMRLDSLKKIKLSENFSLGELVESSTAYDACITQQYEPTAKIKSALKTLVEKVLQPARTALGVEVIVNSGYRCEELNNHPKIGGSKTSHHLLGMAADIRLNEQAANGVLFEWLRNNCDFTQLIWYYDDDVSPCFIHVSYEPGDLRKEVLICSKDGNGKKTYEDWEVK